MKNFSRVAIVLFALIITVSNFIIAQQSITKQKPRYYECYAPECDILAWEECERLCTRHDETCFDCLYMWSFCYDLDTCRMWYRLYCLDMSYWIWYCDGYFWCWE